MIRWIFVLLLLANGFYAFWWQSQGASPTLTTGPADPEFSATLMLVTEAEPALLIARRQALDEPPAEKEEAEIASACWLLGTFAEKARADRVVSAIQAAQLEAKLDTIELPGEPDYWVHVGPFPSRDRALAVLQQLRGQGIDSFLITEGELENAVSLGFFSQKALAERLLERYVELSHPPQVLEVKRYRPGYRVYAWGRIERDQLMGLMAEQSLALSPSGADKKSCN